MSGGDIHAGPLPQAPPSDEHHAGPLEASTLPARVRKSSRERRWERRRRRRMTEEVMGWILVPIILIVGVVAIRAGLNAMGTSPTALIEGIKTVVQASGRL